MRSTPNRATARDSYLSWLPREERLESRQGGSEPLTLVRSCGEARDDPASPFLGIQVLMEGEADLECDLGQGRFRHAFRPGDFVVVPPATDISFQGPSNFHALSLAIPCERLAGRVRELGAAPVESWERIFDRAHDDERVSTLITLLWQELDARRPDADLFLDGLWQSLLVALLRLAGQTPSRPGERLGRRTLDALQEFVRASLHGPIRIEELARQAGMSAARFSQVFREETGSTPSQFVMGERLARAQELLRGTREPISEIALATGFCDQSHFTRSFKRRLAVTPAAFRAAQAV